MKINQNPLTKIIKNTKILYMRVSMYLYMEQDLERDNGKDP
jgi:hypothetical protein